MELNPQRAEQILRVTGWPQIAVGTLNLQTDNKHVEELLQFVPVWVEDGASVIYPPRYARIPLARKQYLYFRAIASAKGRHVDVLVRRAAVPPYPGLAEVFAAATLRDYFPLVDNDIVTIELDERGRRA